MVHALAADKRMILMILSSDTSFNEPSNSKSKLWKISWRVWDVTIGAFMSNVSIAAMT